MNYCLRWFLIILFISAFPVAVSYALSADETIQTQIKDSYTFRTYLKEDDIAASTRDGIVTLEGSVADEYHRLLAVDTVVNLPGVKSVNDRLMIVNDSPVEFSDAWLSLKIKTLILFHFKLNPLTKVYANGGIVTLKGQAESDEQKAKTAEYVKGIEGVKAVDNEMTVEDRQSSASLGEKIDDASITAQIKLALLFQHSLSAFKTGVHTEKGVVTLTGEVDGQVKKEMIHRLVSDIKGVKKVENQILIK